MLTNAGGSPVNSAVVMTFRIYGAATGGTALYTETQLSVTVTNGNFNAVIGSVTPLTLPLQEKLIRCAVSTAHVDPMAIVEGGVTDVRAGQAIICERGEWIRYSSPGPEGAEYIAVCLPAFSPDTVHRDE